MQFLPHNANVLDVTRGACFLGKVVKTIYSFQACVQLDDIYLSTFTIPFLTYEWTVAPMGFCNLSTINAQQGLKVLATHLIA